MMTGNGGGLQHTRPSEWHNRKSHKTNCDYQSRNHGKLYPMFAGWQEKKLSDKGQAFAWF
jgi:hypothetical protein